MYMVKQLKKHNELKCSCVLCGPVNCYAQQNFTLCFVYLPAVTLPMHASCYSQFNTHTSCRRAQLPRQAIAR
jgi:hypothetical protein